ncbi:MAG: hypothetical protein E6G79_10610 [Alphaproteobacteria bacterium]|nr:MAG: hypothetical protein E6G79_10610 [Alphaproteobacteria bacterium]
MNQSSIMQQRFQSWLVDSGEQAILRWIFRGTLIVTVAVLALDLADLQGPIASADTAASPAEIREEPPALNLPDLMPSILGPLLPSGDKRVVMLPEPDGALARPMTFELVAGGKLMATGTITPGISAIFAAEVGRHGDYIKTVVLESPGGSVADALAIGRLIREKNFATEVEARKYCASSCPLVLAGGVERRAGEKATIGVHQVAAVPTAAVNRLRDDMSVAQTISARCQHYLSEMGVSLQVWVHAMETPHNRLFVFKADELKALNLVTTTAVPAAAPAPKARS